MDEFLQTTAMLLLAVILVLTVRKQNGEMAVVLSIGACCIAALVLIGYCKPVMAFLRQLQQLGQVDSQMVSILFKVVGISLVSEIAGCICTDSGNSALGKMIQMLAAVMILCLSVPMLSALMDLVQEILGRL